MKVTQLISPGPLGDSIAFFAGILLVFAFAPFALSPLAVLSTTTLLALILSINAKQALWRGWLFGLGLFGAGVYWIYISIHTFGHTPAWLALSITFAFISLLAFFPALSCYLLNRYFPITTDSKLLCAFPAIWVMLEWVRSWLFTGFPWLTLGDSQINSPLKGFAPLFSTYGISLIVLCSSGFLCNAWRKIQQKNYSAFAANLGGCILIWIIGASLSLVSWTSPEGPPIQVSLVQGNIAQDDKWSYDQVDPTLKRYADLTAPHWNSQLIVWPESAIPIPLQNAQGYVNILDATAKKHNAALITGIPIRDRLQNDYFNGIIAVGKNTNDYYLKRRLVPFGEYIPFPTITARFMNWWNIPMSNFIRANAIKQTMQVNGLTIEAFICYEIAFAEQVFSRDSHINLLLTINNDAWFGESIAQAQHLAMAQMRALEMGRPLLFVSNTGITAIIQPNGKIQSAAPPYQPYVLTDTIQPVHGLTPWQHNKLDPVLLIALIFILKPLLQQRKQRKKNESTRNG